MDPLWRLVAGLVATIVLTCDDAATDSTTEGCEIGTVSDFPYHKAAHRCMDAERQHGLSRNERPRVPPLFPPFPPAPPPVSRVEPGWAARYAVDIGHDLERLGGADCSDGRRDQGPADERCGLRDATTR